MTLQRQIHLPEELCQAAERRFKQRFDSVDSLLEFVLRELLQNDPDTLDRAEQALLEERLRNLGYL